MKVVSTEEFRNHLDQYLASAAREEIVIAENGHPYALLQGLTDAVDEESATWASSPDFWSMIYQRRQERAIRREEAKQQSGKD